VSGKLSVDADRYIGYTIDGAQRMTRMINDLLLYSRVGQTKLSLDPTSFDTVIKDVTSDLEGAIERNHAKVTVEKMPTVPAHRGQMTQLIQNLIGNALKYRGERDPEVRINVKKTQDALARSSVTAPVKDNVWLFSVEDNGIGIDEKHFEKVFTIFQRLHTKQEYSGSGIGLAICKKIVERHGGRIWLNSQVGTGSTFYFTLPTREAA
jgi:light-regulated signal transduction histidine kinase (bacteriophytochrome)